MVIFLCILKKLNAIYVSMSFLAVLMLFPQEQGMQGLTVKLNFLLQNECHLKSLR